MGYTFKKNISSKEYINFLKKQDYLSFMQEEEWSKAKTKNNYKIVAVLKNNKICATANILIITKGRQKKYFIPNGYILDFSDKKLLDFMTCNIKEMAKKDKAYVIEIYPNIDLDNPIYSDIHNNLLDLKYKYNKQYFDKSETVLIPMKKKNKKISKLELQKKYENKDFYLKRGIEFEISNDKNDIKRLKYLIDNNYFNESLINDLIINFKDRIKFVFAKLDLIYYKHFLENNPDKEYDIKKITDLIDISDEIDIGCAIIIEPINKNNSVCEFLYNTEKNSFEHLKINNGLLYETMKICNENNYSFIKISNLKLNKDLIINNYNGYEINYVGCYSLIINKIKYFFNKPIQK